MGRPAGLSDPSDPAERTLAQEQAFNELLVEMKELCPLPIPAPTSGQAIR